MKKGAGVAMKNENRMTFGRLPRVAAAATVVVGLIASAGPAGAWSLEEASAPYKGTTIRTIGEALPPLEAMDKLKHIKNAQASRWLSRCTSIPRRSTR
jgi:hypothetical protein